MTLPDSNRAYVDQHKITDYLLSPTHPDGWTKAQFFMRFGFRPDAWQKLADALQEVGVSNLVIAVAESPHGARYTVDGVPDGRTPRVRTVWIVEPGSSGPRLITASPI